MPDKDFFYFKRPVHKIYLKLDITDDIRENLMISVDGSVLGVSKDAVSKYMDDAELSMIRIGYKKYENGIESCLDSDSLYRYLSCIVEL